MRDTLATKSVDAVVATDPFIAQMVNTGAGYIAMTLNQVNPRGLQARDVHRDARLGEGASQRGRRFPRRDRRRAPPCQSQSRQDSDDINVYAKLPPADHEDDRDRLSAARLAPDQHRVVDRAMKQQHMLSTTPDVSELILK